MFKPYVNEKAIDLVTQVLRSGWVGEGARVKEFEEKIGVLAGSAYPIAVNSGTSALHLAVLLAGVQPGDEVITTGSDHAGYDYGDPNGRSETGVLRCGIRHRERRRLRYCTPRYGKDTCYSGSRLGWVPL